MKSTWVSVSDALLDGAGSEFRSQYLAALRGRKCEHTTDAEFVMLRTSTRSLTKNI
jgi:hypothetical protein